jgi:hypothetical protein
MAHYAACLLRLGALAPAGGPQGWKGHRRRSNFYPAHTDHAHSLHPHAEDSRLPQESSSLTNPPPRPAATPQKGSTMLSKTTYLISAIFLTFALIIAVQHMA